MKLHLSQNGNYNVHVEIAEIKAAEKTYAVKFLTTLADAKDPDSEQQKFIMFLTEQELKKLKDFL